MQINDRNPVGINPRLAQAFFQSASEHGAPIYLDSFGQKYFFHRTELSLEHEGKANWLRRVIGVKLLNPAPLDVPPKHLLKMTPESAQVVFATQHGGEDALRTDTLFKELHRAKSGFEFMGYMPTGDNRNWNWAFVEKYFVLDARGLALMELHRYAPEDVQK